MERFKYSVDDGSSETSFLKNSGLRPRDAFWLNQFDAAPEANTITGISLAWGSPQQRALTIDDDPIVVALYEDPNDDGNPDDAVLLATANTRVANPNTDQFTTVSIDPTEVKGSFFVGALLPNQPTNLGRGGPVAVDTSSPHANRSFLATAGSGAFNLENLATNSSLQPLRGGNWLLRAEAEVNPSALEITVDTTADELDGDVTDIFSLKANPGGTGISLREAIAAAQNNAVTINLDGGETYTLTQDNDDAKTNLEGLLNIKSGQYTLRTQNNKQATINGNKLDRVFAVFQNATLNLENIVVTGGQTRFGGGGIVNLGTLALSNSRVTNNTGANGGGIFNTATGKLALTDSVVTKNRATFDGGGLFNHSAINVLRPRGDQLGEITLTRSTVSNNSAGRNGGGLTTFAGSVTLENSTIRKNQAAQDGGGISTSGPNGFVLTQLENLTDLSLTNSTISENKAGGSGGGIATDGAGTNPNKNRIFLSNSRLLQNEASKNGGGISNQGALTTLVNSEIHDNSAAGNGGGFANEPQISQVNFIGSTLSENRAKGEGGGLYNSGESTRAALNRSKVFDNTAGTDGGGIFSGAASDITIAASTIRGNQANKDGGGLHNGSHAPLRGIATVSNSTISGNSAKNNGGGIVSDHLATTNLTQSTVSGNTAGASGGGIYNQNIISRLNKTVFLPGGQTNLANSTVANNVADSDDNGTGTGGGVANLGLRTVKGFIYSPGPVNASNSIFADNQIKPDIMAPKGSDISGSVNGNNHNLVGTRAGVSLGSSIGTGSDLVKGNAGLDKLQDNGGPTLTHTLLENSPARDAGNNTLVPADINDADGDGNLTERVPFDQRGTGFARIGNTTVDIGAVEASSSAATNSDDVLLGTAKGDRISGLGGNDRIRGLGGVDTLIGGTGQDTLTGGVGNDLLTGSAGEDVFALAPKSGTDTISDFEIGVDVIGLSEGLSFSDLSFSGNQISAENQVLATLTGVDTTTLTEDSFTIL